jgi:hypothetical protein
MIKQPVKVSAIAMTFALTFAMAFAVAVPASAASTLAEWTFESSVPASAGPHAAEVGIGTATGFHASASTVYSNPAGNGSTESFSSNNWSVGDYYQFQLSTLGFQDIVVSFDHTSSNTGPRDFQLQASTDGTTFGSLGNYSVLANASPNPVWSSSSARNDLYTFVFSGNEQIANQANVLLRLVAASTVSANGGSVATGGTSRVDNFAVMATPVPEPETYAMLLAGLAVVAFGARRRH